MIGIYARVSTAAQGTGTSLATQEQESRALVKEMGILDEEIIVWHERYSGAYLQRPMLTNVRESVRAGKLKMLIVHSPDRLSRDPDHMIVIAHELQEHGVRLIFVHGPSEESPDYKLLRYFFGYMGQRERAQIHEKTMRGKRAVARSGRMPNGTGLGLYGYDYDPHLRTRVINEAEAAQVRRIFRWASQGLSHYQIATRLNREGIPSKSGRRWHTMTVKRLLHNAAYTGVQYFGQNRRLRGPDGKRRLLAQPEDQWIEITNFTPAIITPEGQRAALCQLAKRAEVPRNRSRHQYVLTGFVTCPVCGTGVIGTSLSRRYRYYRCRGTWPTEQRPQICRERYIPAQQLERVVWESLVSLLSTPGLLSPDLPERSHHDEEEPKTKIAVLRGEVSDLKGQQRRLMGLLQHDHIDQDLLAQQIAPIKVLCDEKEDAIRLLEMLDVDSQQEQESAHFIQVQAQLEMIVSRLPHLNFDGKRATLSAFQVDVLATRGRLHITASVSGDALDTGEAILQSPLGGR